MSTDTTESTKKPDFYCRDWIETQNDVPPHGHVYACSSQCDECVNVIIEHHQKKQNFKFKQSHEHR
jgi:hypothetical protein